MQEPQYRSPGVRELLDAVAKSKVPCMSIMNMPPLPYLKRIPGLATDTLRGAFTDATVWDSFDPAMMTLCSPDPQAFRPPTKRSTCSRSRFRPISKWHGSIPTGHAMLRQLEATSKPFVSIQAMERSSSRSNSRSTTRSSCRLPSGRCCSPVIIAASRRTRHAPSRKRSNRYRGVAVGVQLGGRSLRQIGRIAR